MTDDRYTIAGTDLSPFIDRWLAEIEDGDADQYPILRDLRDPTHPNHADLEVMYVSQRVCGPVWGDEGDQEQLLLFAVHSVGSDIRNENFGPARGLRVYVDGMFDRFHELGEREVARRLRASVARRADPQRVDEFRDKILTRSMKGSVARQAAHDQEMAKGSLRDLRAANALDPAGAEDWG